MGQVLHGSATTTEAVRRAIQRSEESVRALARRHGISPTTVQKWRKRVHSADAAMGPKAIHSTVLTAEEEAMVVAFRRHTLLPPDDSLYALQATIPHLTRSALHRCLQRHGVSRLPDMTGDKPTKQKFKAYPIGYFHIDIAEVRTEEGKLHLYVGIDRTSKFAFVQLHEKADRPTAVIFLEALLEAVPYNLHTILTDNGIQFADLPRNRDGWTARYRVHRFDQICREHGIEHRLTKPNHPWTNGQVERMNRTIKDATVKRYHYESHDQLRDHLQIFIDAYNHGRRLKTLRGLTPYEYVARIWTEDPDRFKIDPYRHTPGPNTLREGRIGGRKPVEGGMRVHIFFGLFVVGIVCSSGVLGAPVLNKEKARHEVLAVARERLSYSANRNKSDANVRLDHADHASFFFDAHGTRPCLPGQDVCSSLIGHFRVDRQSGAVFDEDAEPERQVSR